MPQTAPFKLKVICDMIWFLLTSSMGWNTIQYNTNAIQCKYKYKYKRLCADNDMIPPDTLHGIKGVRSALLCNSTLGSFSQPCRQWLTSTLQLHSTQLLEKSTLQPSNSPSLQEQYFPTGYNTGDARHLCTISFMEQRGRFHMIWKWRAVCFSWLLCTVVLFRVKTVIRRDSLVKSQQM